MTMSQCRYLFLMSLAALNLSACAQQRAALSSATTEVATAVGQGPKVLEPKDFVRASRPESIDYMPVGVNAPPRPIKPQAPEGVKNLEAQLEQRRLANENLSKANEAVRTKVLQNTPKPPAAPPPVKLSPQPAPAPNTDTNPATE